VKVQRLINLQKPWRRIRKRAGLDDVHLHDLRRLYAATAIGAGQDIRIVGAQLGHTQIQTTMRYAHVAMDPLRRATNQVSGVIAALASSETDATEPDGQP